MNQRTFIHLRLPGPVGTSEELIPDLRQIVQARGDTVVGVYTDDSRIDGKGKNAGWRRLLDELYRIDQIVLADVGDLPGRTVKDLLAILRTLMDHGVSLAVPSQDIDTQNGSILDLVTAYRRAKLSQAIKRGQDRAKAAGKKIGRPPIPACVRRQILAELAQNDCSIRGVARKYNVSPASVIAIRKAMAANSGTQAA
jgi:putative DNA-invertase from lambdoid prophage Rac